VQQWCGRQEGDSQALRAGLGVMQVFSLGVLTSILDAVKEPPEKYSTCIAMHCVPTLTDLEGADQVLCATTHADAAAHGLWVSIHAQPLHSSGGKPPDQVTTLQAGRAAAGFCGKVVGKGGWHGVNRGAVLCQLGSCIEMLLWLHCRTHRGWLQAQTALRQYAIRNQLPEPHAQGRHLYCCRHVCKPPYAGPHLCLVSHLGAHHLVQPLHLRVFNGDGMRPSGTLCDVCLQQQQVLSQQPAQLTSCSMFNNRLCCCSTTGC
jgi:hypothetical protein